MGMYAFQKKIGRWLIASIFLAGAAMPGFAQEIEKKSLGNAVIDEAESLLSLIVNASDIDAYIHTHEHEIELQKTTNDKRKSKIYKEIIFNALDIGDSERLEKYAALATALSFQINDSELRIYGDAAKSSLATLNGDLDEGRSQIIDVRHRAEKEGDALNVFFADAMLAIAGSGAGNYLEGLSQVSQQIPTLPNTPRGNRMRMLGHLTIAYIYAGVVDVGQIIHHYKLAAELGLRHGIAFDRESALYNIASSLSSQNENALAEKYFLALREVLKQTKRTDGEYYVLYGLSGLRYDDKKYTEAITLAENALNNYPEDPFFDMALRDTLASSYAQLGDPETARTYYRQTLAFFEKYPDYKNLIPDSQQKLTLAYILRAENKLKEAFNTLNEARRSAAEVTLQQFQNSITDLRSNLNTMLEKQKAEALLKESEDAYTRLIVVFSILIAAGTILLLLMQRRHNRALQRSIESAELANKTKSDFLANMSHELRTPLNAILGFSDMMVQKVFGQIGARQYEDYAVHIHDSGKHLLDIINDILDLSKIESGHLVISDSNIDLHQMFEDARTVLIPRAEERGINIGVHVDDDVPCLLADWRLIKQVLLNLLSNGVKFTEKGGRVTMIAHLCQDGGIQIEVIDTGVGMNAAELQEALVPFGQAGTTMTRSHEGTGLGLPLVKSLVELHGGELFIRSKKNVGTTVQILFPPSRTVASGPAGSDDFI